MISFLFFLTFLLHASSQWKGKTHTRFTLDVFFTSFGKYVRETRGLWRDQIKASQMPKCFLPTARTRRNDDGSSSYREAFTETFASLAGYLEHPSRNCTVVRKTEEQEFTSFEYDSESFETSQKQFPAMSAGVCYFHQNNDEITHKRIGASMMPYCFRLVFLKSQNQIICRSMLKNNIILAPLPAIGSSSSGSKCTKVNF